MNDSPDHSTAVAPSLRDARQDFVRRTVGWLLLFAMGLAAAMTLAHRFDPNPPPVSRIAPPVLFVLFCLLAIRHWRHPDRMASTLWASWVVITIGLAAPVWLFIAESLRSGVPLVHTLPPIASMFFPTVLVMVLFAKPRQAALSALLAWLVIGAPVDLYLLLHPQELWTPRGLDLIVALGPFALLAVVLIPYLRGMEQRFAGVQKEGERLQQLAERDALIGLYNRRAGERFLTTLLAHERSDAAVILFDIDHFKRINDEFGHPVGDAVLKAVGTRCSAVLSRHDIFARWGGEEFLILLPSAPGNTGSEVAERLRRAIHAQPINPVGLVSASFGVTSVCREDTLSEVIQRADDALYQAKAAGRNRVVTL